MSHSNQQKKVPDYRNTVPSHKNPAADRLHPGATHCLPLDHLLTLCLHSPCWFPGCLGEESLCERNVQGKGEPSLPSPSEPLGFLIPASPLDHREGVFPTKSGPWPDLPLQVFPSSPPLQTALTLTSHPAGSGKHLDFRMTQEYSGCLSA